MKGMKLIVLCVDGLDPDYARELGFPKMSYESKLKIPKELYYCGVPHTQLIWPSMLSGRIVTSKIVIAKSRPNILLREIRLPIRRLLHKFGIRWKSKKVWKLKKEIMNVNPSNAEIEKVVEKWSINPSNVDIETVADKYNSIMWNIPTISPEFISGYPDHNKMLGYGRREYRIWKIITYGMCLYPYDLAVAYCHLPDILGHLEKPLEDIYLDIHHHATMLSKYRPLMLVSDHGCLAREHTHHAYLGCTEPIEAQCVLEVRDNIERILAHGCC